MEHIILKIKYLRRLGKSSNKNEASNALAMAAKLMEKHGLSEADVEEKEEKPVYTDDQLFHQSSESLEWVDMLAFAVADKYDSYIIKEENTASTGDRLFKYYVYGDEVDSIYVKKVFSFLHEKMTSVISMNTRGRGKLFIDSYCEGLVNGVKVNLMFEDFELLGMVEVKSEKNDEPAIVKVESEGKPEPPLKEKQEVKKHGKEKPLDIIAYFKGEGDGRNIHLDDACEDIVPDLMAGIDLSGLFDVGKPNE